MFRFSDQTPVSFDDDLPDSVDVAIIGGGVIGISTAWYLRQQGKSVLVCDKGRVAGEQSSRNWGWVRVTARDPDEVPIAVDSLNCWDDLSAELGPELGFTRQGILMLAEDRDGMRECEEWMSVARDHEVDTRMLSDGEIGKLIQVPSDRWTGGMLTPSDGRAEPFKAVPAIARGLQARGGLVKENCAVRVVDMEAGKVTGIVTEHGRVQASSVVCAGGAWSSMFLSNLGVRLPQLTVRSTVVRTAKCDSVFDGNAALKDVFIRRRQDGGYTLATGMTDHTIAADSFRYFFQFLPSRRMTSDIRVRLGRDVAQKGLVKQSWSGDGPAPFEAHRVLNPSPSKTGLNLIRKHLEARVPQLADVDFEETWAGMIDATPDVVPVMDEVASHPGLFLATGFSGHGFGIGPGAGKVMADLVLGNTPQHNLHRFRFSRFSDGSKIRPGPAI